MFQLRLSRYELVFANQIHADIAVLINTAVLVSTAGARWFALLHNNGMHAITCR